MKIGSHFDKVITDYVMYCVLQTTVYIGADFAEETGNYIPSTFYGLYTSTGDNMVFGHVVTCMEILYQVSNITNVAIYVPVSLLVS